MGTNQDIFPNALPTNMIMDFEMAAINSFQAIWPLTEVKGCFFHLIQNIWLKVQEFGLQADYVQDEALALRIRLLPALALELFPQVIAQLAIPLAQDFALYFEHTYVGRRLPGGTFVEPLYPIKM